MALSYDFVMCALEHYWQIYCASYWHYTSKRVTVPVNPVTGSNVDYWRASNVFPPHYCQ